MEKSRLEEYLRRPETFDEFKIRMNSQSGSDINKNKNSCIWPIYTRNGIVISGQELPPKGTNIIAVPQR